MMEVDANGIIWTHADEVEPGDVLNDQGRIVKRVTVIAGSFVKIETDDSLPPIYPGCRQRVALRSVVTD